MITQILNLMVWYSFIYSVSIHYPPPPRLSITPSSYMVDNPPQNNPPAFTALAVTKVGDYSEYGQAVDTCYSKARLWIPNILRPGCGYLFF